MPPGEQCGADALQSASAISIGAPVAWPVRSEAAVNTASPASAVRWAPNTSARRPPSSISPPKHRVYVVTTQVRDSRPRWRSAAMSGRATFTTDDIQDEHELGHAEQRQHQSAAGYGWCGIVLGMQDGTGVAHDGSLETAHGDCGRAGSHQGRAVARGILT
ncbi:hypothetical protein SALBM311S_04419 [Streptomyces alboniger]